MLEHHLCHWTPKAVQCDDVYGAAAQVPKYFAEDLFAFLTEEGRPDYRCVRKSNVTAF